MATKQTLPDVGPTRKTGAIRKQIVRNTEQPVYGQPFIRDHIKVPSSTRIPLNEQFKINIHNQSVARKIADTGSSKFRQPELCSTLAVAEQLNAIQLSKPHQCKVPGDMTPRSKAAANTKITNKLNIPSGKHVFDNLTPINVNDSVLAIEMPKRATKPIAVKACEKDPVPNLADYLTPIEPLVLRLADGDESDKLERKKGVKPRQTTTKEYWDIYEFFDKLK